MRSWRPRRPHRPRARGNPRRWTQDFARYFPSWLRERGEEYLATGAVVLDAVSDRHVRGTVLGAERHLVELRRRPTAVALSCSCPYYRRAAGAWKHLWAL